MDWAELMENFIFSAMFLMAMMFLYVIFGFEVTTITVLSLIYLRMRLNDE